MRTRSARPCKSQIGFTKNERRPGAALSPPAATCLVEASLIQKAMELVFLVEFIFSRTLFYLYSSVQFIHDTPNCLTNNTGEWGPPSLPPDFRIPRGCDTPGPTCHSQNVLPDSFGGCVRLREQLCRWPHFYNVPTANVPLTIARSVEGILEHDGRAHRTSTRRRLSSQKVLKKAFSDHFAEKALPIPGAGEQAHRG